LVKRGKLFPSIDGAKEKAKDPISGDSVGKRKVSVPTGGKSSKGSKRNESLE